MKLYCVINGKTYDIVEGASFSDEYNETLDSGSIIIDQVEKISDLEPFDDVFIYDVVSEGQQHNFYKHMLVDSFSEEMNNVYVKQYKYKISLFSEIKKLEKVILPNISITQPVDKSRRRSVYEYLNVYLNLYSPKIKISEGSTYLWHYEQKYSLSQNVQNLFSSVDAPELSLTNPTLRDVISQLMLVKDCIPVVNDDVIDYIDISLRRGTFSTNNQYVNYVHSSMNSGDFSTEARREYSGSLSQNNTGRLIEKIGFRNSNTGIMKMEDLVVETRFPIYKINKMYMCYYKNIELEGGVIKKFLCKQNITPLIQQSVVRNALSKDYYEFEEAARNLSSLDVDFLSKYRWSTLAYDIGSNRISGWGEKYEYYTSLTLPWFKAQSTVLQNLICFFDYSSPFGVNGIINAVNDSQRKVVVDCSKGEINRLESGTIIVTGGVYTNVATIKGVFFEIDYNAMYNGALVHSKDFKEKDDLVTTDNCSSSLTILEVDGLYEKEKMNRLGNRQYNIQARYEGSNAYSIMNSTCNHILGSVYDDDVIIYHREYTMYDNLILANFTGTFDYVLKNYFTSVFAKLRTYNLASYNESVVRTENYKEYVVLNDKKVVYESGTMLLPYISKYISCFEANEAPKNAFVYSDEDVINFAYLESNNKKAFSDVNVFCSGTSLCINLKMYDNVTNGVYINKTMINLDESGTSVQGTTQQWDYTISNPLDAFQETMNFGFGHIYTQFDTIPQGKSMPFPEKGEAVTDSDIASLYNTKLLKLPSFNQISYLQDNAKYVISFTGNGKTIYKDNKEVIDYTFQFETITNSSNIFFSSYFTKLSDMSGTFSKFDKNITKVYFEPYIKMIDIHATKEPADPQQQYGSRAAADFKVPKDTYWFISSNLGYVENIPTNVINFNYKSEEQPSAILNVWLWKLVSVSKVNDSYELRFRMRYKIDSSSVYDGFATAKIISSDSNYYYFRVIFDGMRLSENYEPISLQPKRNYNILLTNYTGDEIEKVDYTKNMFAIVSDNDIKKEIVYDTYETKYGICHLDSPQIGSSYEGDIFNINFKSKNIDFKGIELDLQYMYYIKQDGTKIMVYVDDGSTQTPYWEDDDYADIEITGGDDLGSTDFVSWLKLSTNTELTKSGITIPSLPSYMHIINTDDSTNIFTNNTYIPFSNVFKFSCQRNDVILDTVNMSSFYNQTFNFNFTYNERNYNSFQIYPPYINFREVGQASYTRVYYETTGWQGGINKIEIAPGQTLDTRTKVMLETFSSFYSKIPTIHVGNNLLSNYPNHKSIQFWYLDNNGTGAGKLQFVFGMNTTSNTDKIFASVLTKRSPNVYSSDHKTIVGKVTKMDESYYMERNEFNPTVGIETTEVVETQVVVDNGDGTSTTYDDVTVEDGIVYFGNLPVYNSTTNVWLEPQFQGNVTIPGNPIYDQIGVVDVMNNMGISTDNFRIRRF